MLFNSLHFAVFFPVIVTLYFLTPFKYRWALLLAASYYFYMAWIPELIVLILASTVVDYFAGIRIGTAPNQRQRKLFLLLSLGFNLGVLFFFKYFNFFTGTMHGLFEIVGVPYRAPYLDLILPVGISFYTFHTLSYSIDVYRGDREPERHLGIFALYVAFFPQLVAGPIERSTRLIPQFYERHAFNTARVSSGLRLMLWGFFMKVVIADRAGMLGLPSYQNPGSADGLELVISTYLLTFVVYCDFAGYSAIAIGAARVMGFDLMENFRRPYLATNFMEFWRRWHISLITWFTDYVYIPLGGNRVAVPRALMNLMIVYVISGLWHGANWTFVIWGALNGVFVIVTLLLQRTGTLKRMTKALRIHNAPGVQTVIGIVITYHLFMLSGVFFMSPTLGGALTIFRGFFGTYSTGFITPYWIGEFVPLVGWIALLMVVEVYQEFGNEAVLANRPIYVRWAAQYGLIFAILTYGVFNSQAFVYYQF